MSERFTPVSLASSARNLRRLVWLRNIAILGQLVTIAVVVMVLELRLPLPAFVTIIGASAGLNLLTWLRLRWPRPVGEIELFAQLLLDVVALTALLYFSGGSTNPFVLLYLLPLTLTAAALPWLYAWVMAAVTVACYTFLMFWYVPLPHAPTGHDAEFGLHVLGMWLGFVVSAWLIAYFAVKMAATVRERERVLAAMREEALRHERVLALGTLAAGAAHELGTPLSTMAVLVKDLVPEQVVSAEKLAILRSQIARCKEILGSLSVAAGQVRAESGARLPLDVYLEEVVRRWGDMRPGVQAQVRFDGVQPAPLIVAEQTLSQAIANILNNAADASPDSVELDGRWTQDELTLEIADRGAGFAPEVMARTGEPFVTTKAPGEGLGLGLFLACTTLQRLGGTVHLFNRAGGGVRCRLTLPLAPLRVPA